MAAPTKIILKNSTKMSLNARFSGIMKSRPAATPTTIRAQAASDRFASAKNRRLAQQMERRPSVAAELEMRETRSVRDRLGFVPSRGRGVQASMRGRGRGRFQRGRVMTRGAAVNGRGASVNGRGRGFSRGRSPRGYRGFGRGLGRGRGRGRGRGASRGRGAATRKPPADKQKLDEQLDSYMNKTKSAMNAELDVYMAEIKDEK